MITTIPAYLNRFYVFSVLTCLFLVTNASSAFARVPTGHGTYVFDFTYDQAGKKTGHLPGLFANQINDYNVAAEIGHKLTQVFTYAGDMEMYCRGSGGTAPDKPCTRENMKVFYSNGSRSAAAYFDETRKSFTPADIMPVIDGRVNQTGADDYLRALNNLDQATAKIYADKVAELFCNDKHVSGIQFDIEPFDITQPGQSYFYQQIAKDLAGMNHPGRDGSDPLHCVDENHPQGRFFSIFTVSHRVNDKVAEIVNRYDNGYIVDALYDLGPKSGGIASSPEEYRRYVSREVGNMLEKADQYKVRFQFAIPVAATVHEFESRAGKMTGFKQIDYVKAAISAINDKHARDNKNYLGMATWTWIGRMTARGEEYTPSMPTDDIRAYLTKSL